ncbi:MAG: sugar phosphate isomerase/epimerase family protein [Candidatus Bathyarchaeota archaeon]|jgi:sugar phosphate isomerase/epimerase
MKRILLCDWDNYKYVASIARKNNVGIEFQSFCEPEILDNPKQTILEHQACKDVVYKTMHGAFYDLYPGSYDPLVSEVARKRVLQSLQIAEELSFSDVVFHHDYVPNASIPEEWTGRLVEFWKGILEQTPERIRLHLENVFDDTPKVIKRLVDRVNSPRLGICLDIGHAYAFSETSVSEWVETLGSRISYVHIHDNNGKKDEHLAIGDGSIPIKRVLDALETHSKEALWALEQALEDDACIHLIRSFEWIKKNYLKPK